MDFPVSHVHPLSTSPQLQGQMSWLVMACAGSRGFAVEVAVQAPSASRSETAIAER